MSSGCDFGTYLQRVTQVVVDGPQAVVPRIVVHLLVFLFAAATILFYILSAAAHAALFLGRSATVLFLMHFVVILLLRRRHHRHRVAFFLCCHGCGDGRFTCVNHGLILGRFAVVHYCGSGLLVREEGLLLLLFGLTGGLAFDIGRVGLVDLPDLIASYIRARSHRRAVVRRLTVHNIRCCSW